MSNIYQEKGYNSRDHYLKCLSNDYGVPLDAVKELAELLGENEDYDGLVSAVQDAEEMYEGWI